MNLTHNGKPLRGPIFELSLADLVEGHPVHGHNFQDMINEATDDIKGVAEYHVREVSGKFSVFYLTFEDLGE